MTRVFHGPIGIFNFVHVQSFCRLALKITTAFEMHQSISSLYFCGD